MESQRSRKVTDARKHDRLPALDPLLFDDRFASLHVRVYDYLQLWSPALTRSRARDVLVALVRHLYTEGGGRIADAEIVLSQISWARELSVSRHWLGVLLTRLRAAGWITFEGAGGAATCLRAGPQLVEVERLLIEGTQADGSLYKCSRNM
jgi:hypothetical protein